MEYDCRSAAMIRATGAAQLIQHVDEIKKDLDATEKALELTEPSLGVPLKVLEQQRALQKVMAASLQFCVIKLQEMVAQAAAAVEEKTVNPEIEPVWLQNEQKKKLRWIPLHWLVFERNVLPRKQRRTRRLERRRRS